MTIDLTANKAAVAAVKAAEKAYVSAEKKSAAAREKYLELQADTNRKARELAHARTNPDLYDDDPLTVVSPSGGSHMSEAKEGALTGSPENEAKTASRGARDNPAPTVSESEVQDEDGPVELPGVPADEQVPTEPPAPVAQQGTAEPWEIPGPPAPEPAPAPAKKPRARRQSAAQKAAAEAAQASTVDGEDVALDGDAEPSYDSPVAAPSPMAAF